MSEIRKQIIVLMLAAQTKLDISQHQMAALFGTSQYTIHAWLTGRHGMRLETAEEVLRILGYELKIVKKEP